DPAESQLSTLVNELTHSSKSTKPRVIDVDEAVRTSPSAKTSLLVPRAAPTALSQDDNDDAGSLLDAAVFDTASAIQRTATGPKYASLIERLTSEHPFQGDYADLVERFPCLASAPGVRPFNPFDLDAWSKGVPVEELESWRPGTGTGRDRG